MKSNLLLVGLLLVIYTLLWAGCSNTIDADESPDEITFIPKANNPHDKSKSQGESPDSPFSCLVSTLANNEADYNYWNISYWVHIPDEIVKETDGKTILKAFVYTDELAGEKAGTFREASKVVRVAQCRIPDSEKAIEIMDEEFKKFRKKTWLDSERVKKVANIKQKGDWECTSWYTVYICQYNTQTDTYYNCKVSEPICAQWVYVEGEDSGGGGGTGGPSEDPGYCDPNGLDPCFDDGDGGSAPAPPCSQPDPPKWCTDPCETGDPILDNTGIQEAMELIWEASKTNLPIAQRVEQGGYITKSNGKYGFKPFTNMTHSACGITGSMAPPNNTVAYVHTHPFFVGENTTSVCGTGGVTSHQSTHSSGDYATLYQLASSTGNNFIKGYVLDGNNIVSFALNTPPGFGKLDSRCGY
ncbi:MAG: hypothetical protein RLN81_05065 [Balneolaceae bacterium]